MRRGAQSDASSTTAWLLTERCLLEGTAAFESLGRASIAMQAELVGTAHACEVTLKTITHDIGALQASTDAKMSVLRCIL